MKFSIGDEVTPIDASWVGVVAELRDVDRILLYQKIDPTARSWYKDHDFTLVKRHVLTLDELIEKYQI